MGPEKPRTSRVWSMDFFFNSGSDIIPLPRKISMGVVCFPMPIFGENRPEKTLNALFELILFICHYN